MLSLSGAPDHYMDWLTMYHLWLVLLIRQYFCLLLGFVEFSHRHCHIIVSTCLWVQQDVTA